MNTQNLAVLSDQELAATTGGINSSDAIAVGSVAVGVALCVLFAPVGAGVLMCCLAGGVGVAGDAYIGYGLLQSQ